MFDLKQRRELMKKDNIRSAEVIQVIKTVSIRGKGTKEDPVREIITYWSLDGEWLAERDMLEERKC
jgi:hypothetical protein